jgi:indole-3-acetate monooxygenase
MSALTTMSARGELGAIERWELLEFVRGLRPQLAAQRETIEQQRGLPRPLFDELLGAGLFHMLKPRAYGGLEVDPMTFFEVVAELARVDASTAWLIMINNNGALITSFLEQSVAHEVYARGDEVLAGALVPSGQATPVPGGYRINGRWAFGSGVVHSDWVVAACRIVEEDAPRIPGSPPDVRAMIVPAHDVEVIDTWSVTGLRGTGSHDFEIANAFVPAARSFTLLDPPVQPGPLYRFPVRGLGAAGIAAVALGTARAAIDALMEIATTKTPTFSGHGLADRPLVQMQLAQAEAQLSAARSWLFEIVRTVWAMVCESDPVSRGEQALLRLAATHAVGAAADTVNTMHSLAGGTAIRMGEPLERIFRDMHTARQHFSVQPSMYEPIGRALLGLPPDATML